MNEAYELTSPSRSRYYEHMAENGEGSQEQDTYTAETPRSAPVNEAAQSLLDVANSGTEEQGAPKSADAYANLLAKREIKDYHDPNRTTKQYLAEMARKAPRASSPGELISYADNLVYSARSLARNLLDPKDKEKLINEDKIVERAQLLRDKLISAAKQHGSEINGNAEQRKQAAQSLLSSVAGGAGEIAALAKSMEPYFQQDKVAPQEKDPYKPIGSFEELMAKWVDVVEDKFRPGGEFSLIDTETFTDEYGREITLEKAHPENFLRWVREKIEFYHDFDPYQPVKLFESIYLIMGFRQAGLYEMVVSMPNYFYHRHRTDGDLVVTQHDLDRAEENETFKGSSTFNVTDKNKPIDPVRGYYTMKDPLTGENATYEVRVEDVDPRTQQMIYKVYEKDDKGEYTRIKQALLQDRDDWQADTDPSFEKIKEGILYEVWLFNNAHNHNVAYKQEGMPSEKELPKVMAQIYAENHYTDTPDRYLRLLHMPTTVRRNSFGEQEESEEIKKFMSGELGEQQGSVGKAMQRATMAYYHSAEGDQGAKGYKIEGKNPFKEMLRGKDVDGADIFYRSLIRQTLEKNFADMVPQGAKELVEVLNGNFDNLPQLEARDLRGIFPLKRQEWDKVTLTDVLFRGGNEMRDYLLHHGFSDRQINAANSMLQKKYAPLDVQGKSDADITKALKERKFSDDQITLLKKQLKEEPSLAVDLTRNLREDLNNAFGLTLDQKKWVLFGKKGIDGKYAWEGKWKIKESDLLKKGERTRDEKEVEETGYIRNFLDKPGMEALDGFAVKFMCQTFDKEYTSGINVYEHINYSRQAKERVRKAIQDALVHTEKLDAFEALYAEEWAFTFTYFTGISARNDMQGIGHDAWSKVLNTEYYRLRQTQGGNYYGNLYNLFGIHRLGVDFWEGMKVEPRGDNALDKTLYEVMTGLHGNDQQGYVFDINKNISYFEFSGNAMRQFFADHVSHAIALFEDLTSKHEYSIDKLLTVDTLGRYSWNQEELVKIIDGTWKHLRYALDNRGFLYDNPMWGWWQDASINDKGQVSRKAHFGMKTLRELMFSPEVRGMNMYNRKEISSWYKGEDAEGKPNKYAKGKAARDVFAYLIAKQIEEHVKKKTGRRLYSADQVELIVKGFMKYAVSVMEGKNEEPIDLYGFFSPEEVAKILLTAHAILWMLYAKEYGFSTLGGFFAGLFDALSAFMKQMGAGVKF